MSVIKQEGGTHYASEYQHWDWVVDVRMNYLFANATKYLTRWRKKNGLEDLKKARTYLLKAKDRVLDLDLRAPDVEFDEFCESMTLRFLAMNEITDGSEEGVICLSLALTDQGKVLMDLDSAVRILDDLIERSTLPA